MSSIAIPRIPLIGMNGAFEFWDRGTSFIPLTQGEGGPPGWVSRGGADMTQVLQETTNQFQGAAAMEAFDNVGGSALYMEHKLSSHEQYRNRFISLVVYANNDTTNSAATASGISLFDDQGGEQETQSAELTLTGTFQKISVARKIRATVTAVGARLYPAGFTAGNNGAALFDNAFIVNGHYDDIPFDVYEGIAEHLRLFDRFQKQVGVRYSFIADTLGPFHLPIQLHQRMRANPTVALTLDGGSSNVTSITATNIDEANFSVQITPTAIGAVNLIFDWTADAEL